MRRFYFLLILFFGCSESQEPTPKKTVFEDSKLVFVVDDVLWKNYIDRLVNQTFEANIEGLSSPEPMFLVLQTNKKGLKETLKNNKNILGIIFISELITAKKTMNWDANFFSIELRWEKESQAFLKELIRTRDLFILKELKETTNYISKKSKNEIEKDMLSNFGFSCIIPEKYTIIKNTDSLFLASYDPPGSDEIKNILIFSFESKNKNINKEVLLKTDSVFGKYFIGEEKGSRVRIDPNHVPYINKNNYRGIWRLENGWMGGVFVIKTRYLKGRVVVSSGMVFSPNTSKRKHIKEFEAIL